MKKTKKARKKNFLVLLRKKYTLYSIYDLGGFILISIVYLFFIITVVITPCTVDGDSMEGTYYDNDRVLVWNLGYEPHKDDVIVFDATGYGYMSDSEFFIKRIIVIIIIPKSNRSFYHIIIFIQKFSTLFCI